MLITITPRQARVRDWLGQTQNFIGNVPIEGKDPKAKKRKGS